MSVVLPSAQVSTPATTQPVDLRFSLQSLIGVTTVAAITFAILCSGWDRDEQLFIAVFPAGMLVGASYALKRRSSGILEGAIGGAIACILSSCLVHRWTFSLSLHLTWADYLRYSIPLGAIGGGLGAFVYLVLFHPENFTRLTLVCLRAGLGCVVLASTCFAVAALAWNSSSWSCRTELTVPAQAGSWRKQRTQRSIVAISSSGDYLAIDSYLPGGKLTRSSFLSLDLYHLVGRRLTPVGVVGFEPKQGALAFSADDLWFAFRSTESLDPQVIALKLERGQRRPRVTLSESKGREYWANDAAITISNDGSQILVSKQVNDDVVLETHSQANPDDKSTQLFKKTDNVFVSPSGKYLVKLYNDGWNWRAEVIRRAVGCIVARLDDVSPGSRPVFDQEESKLAFYRNHYLTLDEDLAFRRIWSLSEGKSAGSAPRVMPGDVVGLLSGNRALVVVPVAKPFTSELPFIRHWYASDDRCRLCVVDQDSGEVLKQSGELNHIWQVVLSRNGRVAVTIDEASTAQVWDVP